MPSPRLRLRDLVRADRQARRALAARGSDASPPADLLCRPVLVGTTAGAGERGCLVFSHGRLVAVLVRLGREDGASQHAADAMVASWFLEAGFGPCAAVGVPPLFGALREALAWVRRRLALGAAGSAEALRAAFDHARWLHGDTERILAETRAALAAADQLLTEREGAPPPWPE